MHEDNDKSLLITPNRENFTHYNVNSILLIAHLNTNLNMFDVCYNIYLIQMKNQEIKHVINTKLLT
jgi:hypothetical protein